AVNISDTLETLYKSIHGSLSRIIDTTNFWIALYHEEKDSLSFVYVVDTVDDPAGFEERFNVSDPHTPMRATEVIRTGKPVLSIKADFLKKLKKINRQAAKTISEIWLGVPLKIQGKVIGVMAVHSFDNPQLYDEKDADILMSVSEQVALAIEHKKAEEALQVEKARLEHLFADSREAIVMTDVQGRILKVNQAFTVLFGYQAGEIMNRFIDDLIAPDEFLSAAKTYTVALSKGESDTIEVIRRNKEHKRLNTVATGIPIFVNGTVMGMYCIYRNITEQRRAENIQALLYEIAKAVNSTQSLSEFFKSMHQSLGRILDTTNFFIALYDREKERILFDYYVDERDKAITEIPIDHPASLSARVIRSKKPYFLKEEEIIEIDKQYRDEFVGSVPKIWMGVPLLIRDEIIGAVALQSYRDSFCYSMDDVKLLESVSEQIAIAIDSKRTRDALEESEKRYRTVFDGTADAILVHDMGKRFLDVNELACERYGYSRDEMLNMEPKDITVHKQAQRVAERVAEILRTGHYMSEVVHVRKDGIHIPTELSSKIIEYLGRKAVLSVARDITERKKAEEEKKKLEEQLRQAQKMEAIGTLAGGIAHDFNNILSPIIGYTELSLYQLEPGNKAHKNMHEVLKAAERAKNLVKQILTFSRQSEQEPKPIKVGPIIQEVAKLLQATLPSFIQVVLRISEEQGAIMADPTQIHQVLMNLGTNAYHAMKSRGGILEINLSEVVLSFEDRMHHHNLMPGPYLKLSVSDTGHGINPMVIGRIFDPYFTTKAPGEGTGMGLAVVHGIIKGYKGEISVYSEPEVGTSFHVYLPEIVSEVILPLGRTSGEASGGNEKILIVDDEEQIVDMLQQMLSQLGYRVTARTSSVEALEAFRVQPNKFDLIITDQTMPNISGVDLARMMLEIRKEIPIILCTGFSEVVTESQAKTIGIREYVMKPIIKNEMATVIRRILDNASSGKND
ncbi:MAG: PAS domain S-box protein, partial [Desulfobacteraceae bacterium]